MNFVDDFEELVTRENRALPEEILITLSQDLSAVDVQVLSNNSLILISEIENDEIFFFELAVLCKDKAYSHPEWSKLSGRVKMLYIKRSTPKLFGEACKLLEDVMDKNFYFFCISNSSVLEKIVDKSYDWIFDIFAVETLYLGYLAKTKNQQDVIYNVETPQYMYLRVAAFLWYSLQPLDPIKNLKNIKQCYIDLASGKISAPSPMLFNAGMKRPQMASCFLLSVDDDMRSICKSWHDSAIISMNNGGVGLVYDELRHSEIGNHGLSQGIVPWAKIQNEIMATVNQGGKRKGSATVYICDWHRDILEFIDLKDPLGKEEVRARDLFYGIMVSDLFMNRVAKDEMWSVFCPAKTQGLSKTFGKVFEEKYLLLEQRGLLGEFSQTFRQIKARDLWKHILSSQIKTGMPFIKYKDAVNRKNNQKNLGTIRTSNLCVEIDEYVDKDNIATCNLSSIPVSAFVKYDDKKHPYFDFEELGEVTRRTMRNLGRVIDLNYYPEDVPQIKYSNLRNRPIGIGIQDLAGCFAMMDYCWGSEQAKKLNEKIARTMYYHGMDENVNMAIEYGCYETFAGSPTSQGLFQFDLWTIEENEKKGSTFTVLDLPCNEYKWNVLRERMQKYGLYFSLLFSQMPTATSAHIRCNNESIEPYTQFLSSRTVLSGQFTICVAHLVKDLEDIGMWNDNILHHLFANQGSIQSFPLDDLEPTVVFRMEYLKLKYKTAFELSQKIIVDLYLARARYQCQSSSNNAFMRNPNLISLNAYHFAMWRGGAKTGMYYLRSTPATEALNFSLDAIHVTKRKTETSKNNRESLCFSCGS
jgi:ribonucleoside-diphosphate reductase alpha chain